MSPIYLGVGHGEFVLPGSAPAHGVSLAPLSVNASSLQFEQPNGTVVALAGYHHWRTGASQIGYSRDDGATMFDPTDHAAFVADLAAKGANLSRIWMWEQRRYSTEWSDIGADEVWVVPSIYAETGPGTTIFGTPKFDLDTFNQEYFDELRQRVIDYGQAGIYCVILLFQGWGIGTMPGWEAYPNPGAGHPYHPSNNINGLDADIDNDDRLHETQNGITNPALPYQKAYVEKVIDTLGDLPHLIYEISNETAPASTTSNLDWAEEIRAHIVSYESAQGYGPHPVLYSKVYGGDSAGYSTPILASSFNAVALGTDVTSMTDPPVPTGKAAIDDTDHITGSAQPPKEWPWRVTLRGRNPLMMEKWDGKAVGGGANGVDMRADPDYAAARRGLGRSVQYANRLTLASATWQNGGTSPCSTGYCIAVAGEGYLCYQPGSGSMTLDLSAETGTWSIEWFDPDNDVVQAGGTASVSGGATRTLTPPFSARHAVALVTRD